MTGRIRFRALATRHYGLAAGDVHSDGSVNPQVVVSLDPARRWAQQLGNGITSSISPASNFSSSGERICKLGCVGWWHLSQPSFQDPTAGAELRSGRAVIEGK
jgi:hypothetical protein